MLAESEIPFNIKKDAIDGLYKKRRAEEEIDILKMELPRIIEYMLEQRQVILNDFKVVTEYQREQSKKVAEHQKENNGKIFALQLYINGCSARLQYELYLLDGILKYFHESFVMMISKGHIPGAILPNLPPELETGVDDYHHTFSKEEAAELQSEMRAYEEESESSDIDEWDGYTQQA